MIAAEPYDVECSCGVTFRVHLSVPAEQLDEESLGRLLTELHPKPLCEGEQPPPEPQPHRSSSQAGLASFRPDPWGNDPDRTTRRETYR